jgi:hypothetical protein
VRAAKSSEIDTGIVLAFRRTARPQIAFASEPAQWLSKQTGKTYRLTLHSDKTRFVDFRFKRPDGNARPEADGTTFTFLKWRSQTSATPSGS